jgi:hypothetical protein
MLIGRRGYDNCTLALDATPQKNFNFYDFSEKETKQEVEGMVDQESGIYRRDQLFLVRKSYWRDPPEGDQNN